MADARPFTAEEKLACARRELAQRRHVYPRRVDNNRMTQAMADRETRLMQAIVADYEELAAKDRLL